MELFLLLACPSGSASVPSVQTGAHFLELGTLIFFFFEECQSTPVGHGGGVGLRFKNIMMRIFTLVEIMTQMTEAVQWETSNVTYEACPSCAAGLEQGPGRNGLADVLRADGKFGALLHSLEWTQEYMTSLLRFNGVHVWTARARCQSTGCTPT